MFIIFIPVATSSKDEHQAPSLREKYIQDIEDFKAKLSKANLKTGKIAKLKSSDFYLSTQKINKMKRHELRDRLDRLFVEARNESKYAQEIVNELNRKK